MMRRAAPVEFDDVGKIVPELRFIAGQYRSTPVAIDDLVELTLRTAVAERARKPTDITMSQWLRRIMARMVLS